jgi:ADP-ribose pyrophosphatase
LGSEETLSSRSIFEGRAVRVRVDTVRTHDGRETVREIVEHDECVAVVAVDNDGHILLVRQFRKPVEMELLEIPAGGIDPGEDPVTAVRREMREETGYRPERVVELGGFYAIPGYGTEYLHLYLAKELVPDPLTAEDTDDIELVRVTPEEILELIRSGEICDAKSIAGLLQYLYIFSQTI